jgi:Leucine-rich repeat (LRR) protein
MYLSNLSIKILLFTNKKTNCSIDKKYIYINPKYLDTNPQLCIKYPKNTLLLHNDTVYINNKNVFCNMIKDTPAIYSKQLNLQYNNIYKISNMIKYATHLEILNLGNTEIQKIPHCAIKYLTNLTHLYLHENNLTCLPKSICNLQNLTLLDCSRNQLTYLPKSLNNLTILNCSENKLKSLPKSLSNLKILYCNDNLLKISFEFLFNFPNLISIDCSNNILDADLPNFFIQLSNVNILNIIEQQLDEMENRYSDIQRFSALSGYSIQ